MANLVYLSEISYSEQTVLTVGTFDGVHEGHKSIIKTLVNRAKKSNCRSVVVTFDPHPREIINTGTDKIKLLTTLSERAEILSKLGVDEMVVIPFTRDFSLLTSSEFVIDILYKKIGLHEFVIGYDHQFGRNREGTNELLHSLGRQYGFSVHVVEAHEIEDVTISSTLVRKELENNGNITLAHKYLGQPYSLSGTVIHGDKRGRLIGFPTANLQILDTRKVIPKNGVYAVNVILEGDKNIYRGMMNIGYRPTFTDQNRISKEVHILGFDQDIYGKVLRVDFLKRIRDEKQFSGIDALRTQLQEDRLLCLSLG